MMRIEEIDRLLAGRYTERDYPALGYQMRSWQKERPLEGMTILDATPIFRNTLLKYRALLLGGARLTVGVSDMLPNDAVLVQELERLGMPMFRAEQVHAAQGAAEEGLFDVVLDCAGAFSACQARSGYVELTRSGAKAYRDSGKRVFMADDGRIKQIETCLGTGESFFRAMRQLGYSDWKNRKLVVFGSGKVGTGLILQGIRQGAWVSVVTDPATLDARVRRGVVHAVDYRDAREVAALLDGAYAVVTATGVRNALEGRVPAERLIASDTLLANMGVEDEYGPSIPAERVLQHKSPLNFILDEPTHLKYIDATMALHNAGALWLSRHREAQGLILPPDEVERELLEVTRREGIIDEELALLFL